MANRNRDAGREQSWRRLLAKHGKSGLSVRAFCRREKLSEPSFYAWRGTIHERDAVEHRQTPRTSPSPGPAFLPVAIRAPAPDGGFVIELRGGRVLRLPESIAASRVAELVHALEAAPVTEMQQ
jgi:hypothetical protein